MIPKISFYKVNNFPQLSNNFIEKFAYIKYLL